MEGVGDSVPAAGRGEVVAGVVGFGAVVHFPGAVQLGTGGPMMVEGGEQVGPGGGDVVGGGEVDPAADRGGI